MQQKIYIPAARRFISSYMNHPPGATQHDLHVVINGDKNNHTDERTFSPMSPKYHSHTNYGKDIGAFQFAARTIQSDLMVFCGSHVHFRQAGWLDVMVNAVERNGPGVYGAYAFHEPSPHIRTTCFWMPTELLLMYPHLVGNEFRYEFEHGAAHSIVRWINDSGFHPWLVTWRGIFPQANWRHVENNEALVLDQHSDRIGYK
jgi:hypothetical protein